MVESYSAIMKFTIQNAIKHTRNRIVPIALTKEWFMIVGKNAQPQRKVSGFNAVTQDVIRAPMQTGRYTGGFDLGLC